MKNPPADVELRILSWLTRRLPAIRGAGVLGNRVASFYTRKPRQPVVAGCLNMRMWLDPHETVDSALLFMPQLYDTREIRFLRRNLTRGQMFVDVGANIGFYSLVASQIVGEHGKVVAIEPVPATFEILERNTRMNKSRNIVLQNVGVSSRHETLSMTVSSGTGLRRNRGGNSFLVPKDGPTIDIACKPLHEILKESGTAGEYILKLDVEGFEYEILRTFVRQDAVPKPRAIVLEQNPDNLEGDSVGLLEDNGYGVLFKTRRHNYVMTRMATTDVE